MSGPWLWALALACGAALLLGAEACRIAPEVRPPRQAREVHREPPQRPVAARELKRRR